MTSSRRKLNVAVVQSAPVLFDREQTITKTCDFIRHCGESGAELILFPEAFVSVYPRALTFGTVVGSRSAEGRALFERYWESSIRVPGPETEKLGEAAQKAGATVAIGVTEIDPNTGATLYCTLVYIGADGHLLGRHRKLKPTAAERVIWGEGDGSTMEVFSTDFGRLGGLICWENYMPLARMALYQQGIEIYLAPTADARDSWQASLSHIAMEARAFVLGCNQFVTKDMYPNELPGLSDLDGLPEILCRGGSAIYGPLGECLAGPLYDEEGILTATLDLSEIPRSRFDFDAAGHYNRPDVFDFRLRGAEPHE